MIKEWCEILGRGMSRQRDEQAKYTETRGNMWAEPSAGSKQKDVCR